MKYDREEILYALHIIKETCEEHVTCGEGCPFSRRDACAIDQEPPANWIINDETPTVWKGLL